MRTLTSKDFDSGLADSVDFGFTSETCAAALRKFADAIEQRKVAVDVIALSTNIAGDEFHMHTLQIDYTEKDV